MVGKVTSAVTKFTRELQKGDLIRPTRSPRNGGDVCDPALTANYDHLNKSPIYSEHGYESFPPETTKDEVLFVLEVVPQTWADPSYSETDCKFLAVTSRGIRIVWAYDDEAFHAIGE